jgi:exonuclease SbcC
VHLDSIFIDEGFGSLDQETLDTAMRALLLIQQTGRTIGIISHVSELKTRIAAQIVVSKNADGGSRAEVLPG